MGGAIAPKATIYFVYGPDALTAIVAAVDGNIAPIVTVSFGGCEIGVAAVVLAHVAQQANAQGITILNSSGDSGSAWMRRGMGIFHSPTWAERPRFPRFCRR